MNDLIKTTIKAVVLFGLTIIFYLLAVSCEQEQVTPNELECSCYEVHEVLEPVNVNGMPQLQWLIEYETPSANMPCSSETEWYYNSNNTQRWKTECQ